MEKTFCASQRYGLYSDIPGAWSLIRRLVVDERKTHKYVSRELKRIYPSVSRGLSERSVRRFCSEKGIHSTSRLDDGTLDAAVRRCVSRVSALSYAIDYDYIP